MSSHSPGRPSDTVPGTEGAGRSQESSDSSECLATQVRSNVLRMTHRAKAPHVASSLSCVDILSVLYRDVAVVDPSDPLSPERDVVVVSKGHAAAALYATLAGRGFFPVQNLESYCADGSSFVGHVTVGPPGVEFSTGALGHGLPYGVGVAMAALRQGSFRRVFVVMSDGEQDEGSNWEAALLAAHHDLAQLTVVIDRNGLQSLTTTEQTLALEPLGDKWRAFGWEVETVNGHNHDELRRALGISGVRPRCVIAETVKGHGVSFMENQVEWHYRPPSDDNLNEALRLLERGEGR